MKISIPPSLIGSLLSVAVRMWSWTVRYERVNVACYEDRELRAKRPVVAIWHDEMFPLIAIHGHENMVGVVSQSRDGEILAQVLTRLGYLVARGSSSRGGLRALIAARKMMDSHGAGVVFTVDGPRGPRHQVKPGAIYLAHKAGSPIIPVRAIMSHAKIFQKAWDKFQLPLPFSRCTIIYGQAIWLPPAETDEEMARQCRQLEELMNQLG